MFNLDSITDENNEDHNNKYQIFHIECFDNRRFCIRKNKCIT